MKYLATIGLEVHAELKTRTKMFCDSKNDPDEKRPNVNICPVCMGHPGTLPVINIEAVRQVVRVGLALGGQIADFTEFDRKNYFYPDIPKGYQISQHKNPLVIGGQLNGVGLIRIHLEEDTARSTHDAGAESLVDFNRAGVPLMELVTEPTIHSAEEASRFAKELQLLLQYLGASDANLEKGEMRIEANVSIAPEGARGTKVEVKNLNSFRAVEGAVEFEIERQTAALERGEKIPQETRGWNENQGSTFPQRLKEESHDYRYFSDPDLPKIYLSEISDLLPAKVKETLPELPWERRARFLSSYGLREGDAEIFVRNQDWGTYFETAAAGFNGDKKLAKLLSNYLNSDLASMIKNNPARWHLAPIEAVSLAALIIMAADGRVSSRGAKDILEIMYNEGGEPQAIARSRGLAQLNSESSLMPVVEKIVNDNPGVVADFRAGKKNAIQYLVGLAMRESRGAGNPESLLKLFRGKIGD